MEGQVLLTAEDVRLSFGEEGKKRVDVLRGVDLTLKRGEIVGLVGPSGSGKTSLMMVLSGLEKVSGGRIDVDGCDIASLDEDELTLFRRRHVGIVFQHFHLMANMTAHENVALPLGLLKDEHAWEKASEMLDTVGLGNRLDHYPRELSGGEQQRVAVARAFVGSSKLVFADEPTGNLDEETGHRVRDLIFSQAEEKGTSVLLISHDKDLALSCTRCVTLKEGKLKDMGDD